MKHLKDAEIHLERAIYSNIDRSQFNALMAIAHALIAQVETNRALVTLIERLLERLPPPAETASECQARLKEEKNGGV